MKRAGQEAASKASITREELNKTAAALLSRAQGLAASCSGYGGDTGAVISLRKDCRAIKTEIQQLKQQCNQLPAPPTRSPEQGTVDLLVDEMRLKAELGVLQREKPDVLTTNDSVRQSVTHQQLRDSCVQLNQLLTALKHERKRVREELQSEQTLLKETLELETALEKELSISQSRSGQGDNSSAELEIRKKRTAMAEESIRSLRESLVQFTGDEIIQPSDEPEERRGGGGGRKRGHDQARVDTMLRRRDREGPREDSEEEFATLADVVQDLISQTLTSPHSPYLPLSSIWPLHGNLLVRSGVIQRHPDNPSLVRVTPFHL